MKKRLASVILCCSLAAALVMGCIFPAGAVHESEERRKVRVGFFAFDGYHMIDDEGNRSGYGYDFIRMISRYLDVDFEYVGYESSWEKMSEMLENGEIDMVTSAQATFERTEKFAFSKPIGKSSAILTVKSDNEKIVDFDYKTYNNMRVGMLRGNSRNADFEEYANENGFSYIPVYFDMHTDMEEALQAGEVDALLSSSLRKTSEERILDSFAIHDFYVMMKKENKLLLADINYAIDQLNAAEGDWQGDLENKYYTHAGNRHLVFSAREEQVIERYQNGEKLIVSCCLDKKPYAYMENGKAKGILFDYFDKLAEYIGVDYEVIVPSDRVEYMEWCETNKMDISLDGRFLNAKQMEEKKRIVTPVYTVMRLAVVTRRDFTGEVKKLAVASAQGTFDIEKDYENSAVEIDYPSREKAMQAVLDGEADATVVYLYTAQQFVNQDERGLLTYTMLESPTYDYHLAFTNNVSHELAGIFTKAMYAMPDGLFEEIVSQYTSYKAKSVDMLTWIKIYPLHTIGILVIIFLLGIFIVLFYEKRKRTLVLQKSVERAEKANMAKSEFLANVSHDLRTPMNAIVGISNLMEKEEDVSPKLREYIGKIRLSSRHLQGLITDVLDMSKIEADEVKLSCEPFRLSEQLAQIENIVYAQVLERSQRLNIKSEGIRHDFLLGDSMELRRVLVNVLSNAVKYTPSGGKIDFDVEELDSESENKAKLKFTVTDNGIGMSEELQKRIFEPFARGEASVTNKVQGAGLGMAIVKNIVKLMGGDVEVKSAVGEGTVISVTVELGIDVASEEKSKAKKAPNGDEMACLNGMNFLCAEDNELNAEILVDMLKLYKAECTVCADGAELVKAFLAAAPGEYDAIITDIQMPNMNGLAAAKAIRESEKAEGKEIPIIAVTANAFTDDIQRSLDAGMDAHIAKPIDLRVLAGILQNMPKKSRIDGGK